MEGDLRGLLNSTDNLEEGKGVEDAVRWKRDFSLCANACVSSMSTVVRRIVHYRLATEQSKEKENDFRGKDVDKFVTLSGKISQTFCANFIRNACKFISKTWEW
ncbi:MAG: hypothetical protein IJT08_02920 [Alphaproteobacteria bacterium]|nr:hypothetical protein [Alphaproteobacteria bacterium]